jgi:hypothetical protein
MKLQNKQLRKMTLFSSAEALLWWEKSFEGREEDRDEGREEERVEKRSFRSSSRCSSRISIILRSQGVKPSHHPCPG